MSNQGQVVTEYEIERMGSDMATQFVLMTLFQLLSEMMEDPKRFRADIHNELTELAEKHTLPPMPQDAEQKVRAVARRILDALMMRSFEPDRS
jgi:hypothetical protein